MGEGKRDASVTGKELGKKRKMTGEGRGRRSKNRGYNRKWNGYPSKTYNLTAKGGGKMTEMSGARETSWGKKDPRVKRGWEAIP